MNAKIQKWGNSLGLRIPKPFADQVGLEAQGEVELTLVHGTLVIRPLQPPAFTLEGLLAGVTKRNRHDEVESGAPVGREGW
ncbi:MAG: AbrB/MazE/SpoVT family DNA-binding domain-containing protein [Thermoanaerobaculia bacterium]